ncbi:hypothetical protein CORC01_08357 [Colletotrichum orchidophilum]|uniref:Zn(2)-C6 fungal-type domain-containing protein n=1 Tax=Colletotrichum orchidophilum TaxID=1209926 RepID=A0A1G4B4Q5_9PEZI|nr:uncharacterized protein CORC01_08357 [Colletotrichum orchidophilum]OHE96285.1 hypothetical protein CORC01_08357 [Colletotrichum orchidophilum]
MASLSTLAEDIMHGICEYLTPHEILQLTLVQKRFAMSFERSLLLHRDLALQTYHAMMSAILRKDVNRIESLLELGYDPNFALESSMLPCLADYEYPVDHLTLQAPLNVALRKDSVVSLILERLYRPECDTHKIFMSYSVLAHAILEDQVDIVKLLHRYGADIEDLSLQVFEYSGKLVDLNHQISVLHLASSGAMIETLLQLAPNIAIDKDKFLHTEPLLLWHVERGTDVHGLRRLLEAGTHVDGARPAKRRIPFCQCQEGVLHVFLDHETPLEAAVWNLDRDAVELLLEWGASMESPPTHEGELTCLHEVVKLFLLEHKPEHLEVSKQIFRLLLNRGFDVNREYIEWTGYTPYGTRSHQLAENRVTLVLEALIYYVSAEMFQFLLDAGADPNAPFPGLPIEQSNPVLLGLSAASARLYPTDMTEQERLSLQIAKLKALVTKRAAPHGADRELMLRVALEVSTPSRQYQVLRVIYDVFGPFSEDTTLLVEVLHRVKKTPGILHEDRQMIEFLIQSGAPVNSTNAEGQTAMHIAYSLSTTSPIPSVQTNSVLYWDIDEQQAFVLGWALGTFTLGHDTMDGFLCELLRQPVELEKRHRNALAIFDTLNQGGADQSVLNNKQETPAMDVRIAKRKEERSHAHNALFPSEGPSQLTRSQCDETRPECLGCVRRGVKCSGYERSVTFRDVTTRAAESSRKFEEARWAALRLEDERRKRRSLGSTQGSASASQEASRPEDVTELPAKQSLSTTPAPAPLPPWQMTNADWLAGTFTLPWPLTDTFDGSSSFQDAAQQHQRTANPRNGSSESGQPPSLESSANRLMWTSGEPNSQTPVVGAPSPILTNGWDEFLVTDGSSSGSSTSGSSPLGEPTVDCQLSIPLEEVLIQHFDRNVLPSIPVALSFPKLFRQSSCFQSAVLALSASNIKLTQPLPIDPLVLRRVCDDSSIWIYYDTAVKGLQAQLQNVGNHRGEELAGAALLLAYHELEAGTARGIWDHAAGLDAIASKLDFAASSIPDLFKAWRMLRYDIRFTMTPTRATCNPVDSYDVSSLLDPQLAIRDILSRLHGMYARYAMEATFSHDTSVDGGSASEKVALWLMSVLGRECDRRNVRLKDFYKENLTPETILRQCDVFARRLDNWHKGLCDQDMPVVKLGTDSDVISGATFETFVTYRFANERKALEYMIYLVCRMTCTYLRSLFDPSAQSSGTDALAKVILGIVCGMNMQQRQQFTIIRVDVLLRMAAGLSEGTNFITTILDYLLPRLISSGLTGPDIVAWVYLKSSLELELRERRKGRAIRMTIEGVEEDCELWQLVHRHPVAAFGDYNGKGYFRDCYVLECLG